MYFDAKKVAELFGREFYAPVDLLGNLEIDLAYLLIKKLSIKYNVNEERVGEMFTHKLEDRSDAAFESIFPVESKRIEDPGSYSEAERRASLQLDEFIQEILGSLTDCCNEEGGVNLEQLNQNIDNFSVFLKEVTGEEEVEIKKEINEIMDNFINTEVRTIKEKIIEPQEVSEGEHVESRKKGRN